MSWKKAVDGRDVLSFVDCDKYTVVRRRKDTPWIELNTSEHVSGSSNSFLINVDHRLDSATARELADRILKWCDEIEEEERGSPELHVYADVGTVDIQVSQDGKHVWLCIDGCCVLRVKGYANLEIADDRTTNDQQKEEEETELERLRRLYINLRYLQKVYVKTIVGSYFPNESEFDDWFEETTKREMKGNGS